MVLGAQKALIRLAEKSRDRDRGGGFRVGAGQEHGTRLLPPQSVCYSVTHHPSLIRPETTLQQFTPSSVDEAEDDPPS